MAQAQFSIGNRGNRPLTRVNVFVYTRELTHRLFRRLAFDRFFRARLPPQRCSVTSASFTSSPALHYFSSGNFLHVH